MTSISISPRTILDLKEEVADLRAMVDTLKGALAAKGMPAMEAPHWARRLTPQERALVGALIQAHPRGMNRWDLLDCLPSLDHVRERSPQLVTVLVHRIRRTFGSGSIESLPQGYKLSDDFCEHLSSHQPFTAAA